MFVLKFSADWCGQCKAMQGTFNRLKSEFPKIKFIEIDIDSEAEIPELPTSPTPAQLVKEFNIKNLPTFIISDNSLKKLDTIIGISSFNEMKTLISNYI